MGLTGLPAIEYEEHTAVRKDITLVIGTAAALIGLLILVVVRSVRWRSASSSRWGSGRCGAWRWRRSRSVT
ncbi:MAG: hypothetical protein M3461_18245 [Pseudomonadota bacterium]|nr:hypothetical protein [Pseudomonadota bacterium]